MPGIRVRKIPKTVSEKHLKIHFSKPSNGGGTILNIYFPLFNNDAVIMFENHTVVDHVISKPHQLHDQEVEVECLPEHMIFVSTEVKLDTNAAVLLQASRNLVDEMQFDKEINVIEDTDQTVRLRGNWFQLEWAWHYLDCFMQQQEIIQSKIPQPDVPQVQPMEIEEDSMRAPLRRSLSPSDVNPALRLSISQRSAAEMSAKGSRSWVSEYDLDPQGVEKLQHDGRQRRPVSTADRLDQHLHLLKEQAGYPGNIGGPDSSVDLLKKNINSSYDSQSKHRFAWESDDHLHGDSNHRHGNRGRRAPSDGESSEDETALKGYAHNVPFESVHSTLGMENRERRQDENSVFEDFSGLRSLQRNSRENSLREKVDIPDRENSSPLASLSHKLKFDNDTTASAASSLRLRYKDVSVSANPDEVVTSRLSSSLRDNSQRSSLTQDDMLSTQNSRTSGSPVDVTRPLQKSRTSRSPVDVTRPLGDTSHKSKDAVAHSPRSSLDDDAAHRNGSPGGTPPAYGLREARGEGQGTPPAYGSREARGEGQGYSLPASLSHTSPRHLTMEIPDRYSEDQLSTQFDIEGVKVVVYYGDLTKEATEAIVNASNEDLNHSGGVAGALLKARGYEMQYESNDYVSRKGQLKITEVMHTSGGGQLKSTHIMHAVGPLWLEFKAEECRRQIAQTFLNCFTYANKILWIRSISLPAISTGVYMAPLDECVRAFLHAILMFVHSCRSDELRLREIRLVNNDAEATVTSIVLMQTLLVEGVQTLMQQAIEVFQPRGDRTQRGLNLPKGRPERSSSLTRTYTREPAVSLTRERTSREATSAREITSARDTTSALGKASNRRRSSSLSRVPDKPKYEKDVYGSQQTENTRSGRSSPHDHKSGSVSDRGRTRTNSLSTPVKTSRDRDVRGADSPRLSSRTSAAPAKSSSSSRKTAPSIKKSLLSQDNMKSFHVKSGTSSPLSKTSTSRMRTSDEKPAARPKTSGGSYERSTRSDYQRNSHRRYHDDDDDDDDVGLRSLPINLEGSSYREKFLELNQSKSKKKADICAICLDVCRQPKQLPKCMHTFCTECIRKHFRTKPTCPVCNAVYGEIHGDQPKAGTMSYTIKRDTLLPGFEREDGTIVITYSFPDGTQEKCHPSPGKSYKGFTRKAYLPNSVEGREVLRMLKKAFDLRLMFTIGQSRTTGAYGALTWNDVHHKTSISGGPTKYGYPDPNYMRRIKDELAAKGITSDRA